MGAAGTESEKGERLKLGPDERQLQLSRWEAMAVEIQKMTEQPRRVRETRRKYGDRTTESQA